jgi:hypothetical protein
MRHTDYLVGFQVFKALGRWSPMKAGYQIARAPASQVGQLRGFLNVWPDFSERMAF